MEKTFKISSTSLTNLNETLTNLNLNEKITNFTPVIVEADGKFTSVIKADSNFDPESLGDAIDAEEENTENKETKQQLLNRATEALKQTVANSKELDEILKKIKELSKETGGNEWKVNDKGNTATLKDKNAYIFKQNDYLCLSHNGKVELFKNVCELRKWLEDNNYPLPSNDIVIHESVEVEEEEQKPARNWYDLVLKYKEKQKADYLKSVEKADNVEECFGGTCTANLGPAVTYLGNKKSASKKEKKEEDLKEAVSFFPGIVGDGAGKAANLLGTQLKNEKFIDEIKQGKVPFPSNIKDYFVAFQMALYDYNVKASTSNLFNTAMKAITNEIANEKPQITDEQIEDAINNSEKYEGLSELIQNTLTSDKFNALGSQEEQVEALKNVVKGYFEEQKFSPEDYAKISNYMNNYVLCIMAGKKPKSLDDMQAIANAYLQEHPEEKENFVTFKPGDSIGFTFEQDDQNNKKMNRMGDTSTRSQWQAWCYKALPKDKNTVDRLYHALFDSDSNVELGPVNEGFTALVQKLSKKNPDFECWYGYDQLPDINSEKAKNTEPAAQEQPKDNSEFSNKLQALFNQYNIDPNSEEAAMIMKKLSQPKAESKLQVFESASKYSWLDKVLGKRLVEDDSPADFATGSPISSDMDAATTDTTADTSTSTDSGAIDFAGEAEAMGMDTGNNFGDVNINTGSYSPEGEDDQTAAPMPDMPEYEIIDVLENEDNPDDIRVKVRNKDTAKVEIKPLSEIDV